MVEQRRKPLAPDLPPVVFGNMPRDGGHLLIETDEYSDVMSDPTAAKYVRPFVGAKQLIHDQPRWCLWLEEYDPTDVAQSPVLKQRLQAVQAFRAGSRAASTAAMAATPHLFGQRSQPTTPYLCIPRHVSEGRRYFPAARFEADVICGDSNFEAPDPDGLLFAIISSSMFLAWQAAVGGRIKSDHRFSNTLVWNNLPLPSVNEKTRLGIRAAGKTVLEARAQHPCDHWPTTTTRSRWTQSC